MDKIGKFIKDNKGCPLTTPAIKQLLVKFMELLSSGVGEVYEVSSITSMSDEVLSGLKVGDIVQKITGNQKHAYMVTYKEEEHGICLSYFDAGYLETVSYDFVEGHWVYNSTDVVNLLELINNPVIKFGNYIIENGKYKWVEELPADYSGFNIYIEDDGTIFLTIFDNGEPTDYTALLFNEVDINGARVTKNGATKLDFASLTHSFNELDSTLKSICETAISTGQSQPCSQDQWNIIKALLDRSLYFKYASYNLIKCAFGNTDWYIFGYGDHDTYGVTLEITYSVGASTISISFNEV